MKKDNITTKVLDHLGLVAGMYDELDLVEQIDNHICQNQNCREISIGLICKALVQQVTIYLTYISRH